MLQAVSFPVGGAEILAILHLPEREAVGGMAILPDRGMTYEHPDVLLLCNALAAAGVGALRWDWRAPRPPLDDAIAEVVAGLRLLKSHPALPGALGIGGFGFGAAVAAVVAGRDSRVKVAVLGGAPAEVDGSRRPVVEVTRTRARVLVVKADTDDESERFDAVLSQARVTHRVVERGGRERMVAQAADWAKETFSGSSFGR